MVGEWINVELQKPKRNCSVLVTDGKYVDMGSFHSWGVQTVMHFFKEGITHWMPLPEPPKKDDEHD